ncbi:MAG: OmpH family outer membrane protein [Bacteroidaceae bacterium]|nr:OmpH family outer membrane protein [Bacteroidaceae bacterium]
MMRRTVAVLAVLLSVLLGAHAQTGHFGYIDRDFAIKAMPQYVADSISLDSIQKEYSMEMERSSEMFERMYVDFMVEQDKLAAPIVAKRQKELQLLLEEDSKLRDSLQKDLEQRRRSMLDALDEHLASVVNKVAVELDLDYVVDISNRTFMFMNPERSVDITEKVFQKLGIKMPQPKDAGNTGK